MRKKALLKRITAIGLAAAMTVSPMCLTENQIVAYAESIVTDAEIEIVPDVAEDMEEFSDTLISSPENEEAELSQNTEELLDISDDGPEAGGAETIQNTEELLIISDDEPEVGETEIAGDTEEADNTEEAGLTVEAVESEEGVFYVGTNKITTNPLNLTTEDWNNKAEIKYDESISGITVPENFTMTAIVSLDETSFASLSGEENYLKIQGVVKLGDNWDWNDSQDIKQLKSSSFTKPGDTYQTDISISFTDITPGSLRGVYFEIVGQEFGGTVTVSDVKLTEDKSAAPLPPQASYIVDDFEDAETGTDAGWKEETGYLYDGGVTVSVVSFNGSNQLKAELDYSKNSAEGWSEAKIKKSIAEGIDVSAFNQLTFDLTYPSDFESFKVKGFANNSDNGTEIINKDTAAEGNDLGDGMKKAEISIKFQPNKEKLTDLTLGIVGVSTAFKGEVYIDNIVLSQYDGSSDFVDITSVPGSGTQADISQMPEEVVLADADAISTARALYSYLEGLDKADQVIFGHQNDTHKCVGKNEGVYSDTKDVTGSISGISGIDSLALTGAELGVSDVVQAVAQAAEISKKAASEGAIITLSTHMPNMSSSKIKPAPGEKYKYDFSTCDFMESKDLSGNCAKESLPGGKYNAQFTTYMDIIADYALLLQEENIPVLYRPYHEDNGNWFWWGAANTDAETYKALFRYTEDYLASRGVHNFIYIYSPNGPISSEEDYVKRYPGDDYVDIVGFDYYNDYNSYPAQYSDSFMDSLRTTCQVVKSFGEKRGKVAVIAETGVRVMKKDGSDNEGLLVKDNPIKGHDWYKNVNQIAKEAGMSYFLAWANFSDTNFYVPYKNGDDKGQELINEFIDFYNEDSSIFANGTNFYSKAANQNVTNSNPGNPGGYFTNVFSKDVIMEGKVLSANVRNASKVEFVLQNGDKTETLTAKNNGTGYEAEVTKETLDALGLTDVGTLSLAADGKILSVLTFMCFGKEKDTLPANVIDNFELYYGDNDYLSGTYTENSAAACSSAFELNGTDKSGGSYGGAFHYRLKTDGPEVWTGRIKGLETNDYSAYNCLTMWIKPDGKGQKLVIQLVSNGEDFEANLADFVKTADAKYVTIPFSELKGKQNGTFDSGNITKFAVWCNSIVPQGGNGVDIDSSIVFDDIQFASVDLSKLSVENGYALTDQSVIASGETTNPPEQETDQPDQPSSPPEQETDQPSQPSNPPEQETDQPDQPDQPSNPPEQETDQPDQPSNPPEQETDQPSDSAKKETKIELSKTAIVKKGETLQLKAVVTPANAKKAGLSWSSSDRKIAVVDNKGKVKGKKYGRVTITAKAKDGSGVKATCKLTVGYGITYKLNKGKNNSENPTVYYNEKVKLRKPSRKGYVFKGWYTDKKFKKKITVIKKGTKKNYTLYAKWKKSK